MDPLTGVPSRQTFFAALEALTAREAAYALVLVDIDRCMAFNDRHGHGEGDAMIKRLAALVSAACPAGAHLCRWSGDEFLMLCENYDLTAATALAEKLRASIEDGMQGITVSVGVAQHVLGGAFDVTVRRVEDATHLAKDRGRNQVALFDVSCEEWLIERAKAARVRQAALQLMKERDLPVYRSFTRDGMPYESSQRSHDKQCWETSRRLLGSPAETVARMREPMPQQHDLGEVRCALLVVETMLLCWCWEPAVAGELSGAEVAARFNQILAAL